jgi:hypothetical protein
VTDDCRAADVDFLNSEIAGFLDVVGGRDARAR